MHGDRAAKTRCGHHHCNSFFWHSQLELEGSAPELEGDAIYYHIASSKYDRRVEILMVHLDYSIDNQLEIATEYKEKCTK